MSEWFSKETFILGKRRWTTGRESFSTEPWRRVRGPRKSVHAKDQRDITAALRFGTAAGSDCPQLPDRPSHRASLPGALCRHRRSLAVVRRLGQHPVGTVVIWE